MKEEVSWYHKLVAKIFLVVFMAMIPCIGLGLYLAERGAPMWARIPVGVIAFLGLVVFAISLALSERKTGTLTFLITSDHSAGRIEEERQPS